LSRNHEWSSALSDFHVEGAIMVGDWSRVQQVLDQKHSDSPAATFGRLLMAMKGQDQDSFYKALSAGFTSLGQPITSSGLHSYNSSYETMVNLHVLHELKMFYEEWYKPRPLQDESKGLPRTLKSRLDSILPSFKTREIVLSYRRAAFATQYVSMIGKYSCLSFSPEIQTCTESQ
jgi:serine/threonine-protein kinase ATR